MPENGLAGRVAPAGQLSLLCFSRTSISWSLRIRVERATPNAAAAFVRLPLHSSTTRRMCVASASARESEIGRTLAPGSLAFSRGAVFGDLDDVCRNLPVRAHDRIAAQAAIARDLKAAGLQHGNQPPDQCLPAGEERQSQALALVALAPRRMLFNFKIPIGYYDRVCLK